MGRKVALIALALSLLQGTSIVLAQPVITIAPDSPEISNCFPFGGYASGGNIWVPYHLFFYQNIPAFNLQVGDVVAFDLGAPNDADIQLQIDMATHDGAPWSSTAESSPFTTIVTNTQTPANPRGNDILGDFELQFTAEAPYSFPGGNLIIRFSNPSASYQTDSTCTQVLHVGTSTDTSGYFIARVYRDSDGVAPWDGDSDLVDIGAFQVGAGQQQQLTGIPTVSLFGIMLLAALIAGGGLIFLRLR
jgi:hypothetical protein